MRPLRSKGLGTSSSNVPPRMPNWWVRCAPSSGARCAPHRAAFRRRRQSAAAQKFGDYFEFSEPLTEAPSHRVLAVLRGEKEEILSVTLDGGEDAEYQVMIADALGVDLAAGGAALRG